MKISVLIPSRLQKITASKDSKLWICRAVDSVRQQILGPGWRVEIIVGVDPGTNFRPNIPDVRWAQGIAPGHTYALNAAASMADGDVFAFLEDDDFWLPERLSIAIPFLTNAAVVTSNQREIDVNGSFIRINDFATPSGWLFRRKVWEKLGPLDETYRFHLDNEYLGRMGLQQVSRIHLVEAGAIVKNRPWLNRVRQFSEVVEIPTTLPLVDRTVNQFGSVAQLTTQRLEQIISKAEFGRLKLKYATIPW